MKNILVERFHKKLGCGAEITRYRETVIENEETIKKGAYIKDKLWDEEN